MEDIRVHVVKRKGMNLFLRYTDPVTGKRHEKNSGTKVRKKAQTAAGQWQAELNLGIDAQGRITRWADFRFRYEEDHAFGLKDKSAEDIAVVFNVIEAMMKPDTLSRITPQWLIRFVKLRVEQGRAKSTIDGDLRQLKAALNWAKKQGYLKYVPDFPVQKNVRKVKLMKGRPVVAEEFDRILDAVDILHERQRESIRFLLWGLWWSGLRIGEALILTWDQWADGIRVDTTGEFVVLLISAEDEKGGKDREYPIAPEFEEFLLSVPKCERKGYVFNPLLSRGVSRRGDSVGKVLTRIGEAAGVKVDEIRKSVGKGKRKKVTPVYASAHDFRRAFGTRWAQRVKPMVLRELMRHASVTTTEAYYVGFEAQETARHLRSVMQAETPRPTPGPISDEKGELKGELEK